jgi:hypothetical protein
MPGAPKNMPASMVMTRINGKDYPLKSVPQCKTCQSPHRLHIEQAMLQGRTYRAIERELEGLDPGAMGHPSSEGIANHYKEGHMPLPQAVQRRLIERRAEEIGLDMESKVESLVDKVTVAQSIVQKGWEMLAADQSAPTVAETISAIKLLHDMEKATEGSLDQEAWIGAVQVMMEVAREVMADDQWEYFGRKLSAHPVLHALARKNQPMIEGEVVD